MRETASEEDDSGLPPPGQRWGAGAQSVLPYLSRTLRAKPAEAPEPADVQRRDHTPDAMNWNALRG
jgi:hypothetical protein